ncbi:MAG: hypothetical protein HQL61_00680 [Magnetococcales bacterium]|uniref:Secreted protein n=1 Tax=Candidatus Magnetobacterium casense TaxID=1455061 RepID=A0ABS6S022_9BACT|nr:hypothetical protein [Candidatus Magnetobacterium casensis]MBF0606049.1 hypothetical protein [Nitrospirota bacterium]MBV6341738.1 hypothetical protein [Candidatus Magnetobacterium casensis]
MLKHLWVFLLVAIVFCQTANAEWVDWVLNTTLDAGFEDNINFAVDKDGRLSDLIASPSVVFGRYYQLGDFTRLRIAADVKAKVYKRYDALNSVSSGVDVSLTHKFGVGQDIPWLRLHSFAGYLSVNETVRNSWMYNGGITLGKRFSDRFDMMLSYSFIYRNGRDSKPGVEGFMGNPFDQTGSKGAIVLNYLLTERLLASVGNSVYYGGISSTNDPSDFDSFKSFTKAIIWDKTFKRRLCTYKFNALVNEFAFGLSYALSEHSSVNVNYTRADGYTSDLHYYDNLIFTNIKYSF